MIQTENKALVAICDMCGEESEESTSFKELLTKIKRQGWKVAKCDDDYQHYCQACSEYD